MGMGSDLWRCSPAAQRVFGEADRATELPLSQVCFEGPADRLTDTAFAQPGVVSVSLAAAEALRHALADRGVEISPVCCAGHSVGELAALAFSGAVELADGLRLVAARGRLMAEASAAVDGSMAAVVGLDEATLVELCSRTSQDGVGAVQVANLNSPGQVVLSGSRTALTRAGELARGSGARRVMELDVSGPFHSVYMQPAADGFRPVVAETPISSPRVPVILNVSAQPCEDVEEIRQELVVQVTSPVRWSDSVKIMLGLGCTVFVELGPGQVLSGLIKRMSKDVTIFNVEDEVSLLNTAEKLAQLI